MSTPPAPAAVAAGPAVTPATGRVLAPDLARGAMLLLIAVANAVGVVFGGELAGEPHPAGVERWVNVLMFATVHARAYPMFAILFGYGVVQLVNSRRRAGATDAGARRVLVRRNLWLVVFGFVHAALLYSGDFLGAYGLTGLVAVLVLLRLHRRVQLIGFWVWGFSLVYVGVLAGSAIAALASQDGARHGLPVHPTASLTATGYLSGMADRLAEWPSHTLTVLGFFMIVWLGVLAAQRRLLEDAAAHRVLLRRVAVGCLAIAFAGGLPLGLVAGGYLTADDRALAALTLLHGASGMFGGPGYVALFGLLAASLEARPRAAGALPGGAGVRMLVALGRRSLSGYLFQSVAWLVLFAPYTLDLARHSSSPLLAGIGLAVAVWAFTVWAADRLGSRPGPAEKLLRRLTYGPAGR